jgi:hypothetical protein
MNRRDAYALWKKLGFVGEPVDIGEGFFGKFVVIDPVWARTALDTFNINNRRKKKGAIDKYADDIVTDSWLPTHEAMGFGMLDGVPWMADGQNRCEAICKANKPITVLAIVGITTESVKVINEGSVRTSADAGQISGYDIPENRYAIAKSIYNGYKYYTRVLSNSRKIAETKEYEDVLEWLEKNVELKPGITKSAAVLAAIARCYMVGCKGSTQKIHVLKDICDTLVDGQVAGRDKTCINAAKIRDVLLRGRYWGRPKVLYDMIEAMLEKSLAGIALGPKSKIKKSNKPHERFLFQREIDEMARELAARESANDSEE